MSHRAVGGLELKRVYDLSVAINYTIENNTYKYIRSTKAYHYFLKNGIQVIKIKLVF